MTDYNDGKWHGWNGGTMRLHPSTVGDMVYKDGCVYEGAEFGDGRLIRWTHEADFPGVVAFRVTKPYREPKEIYVLKVAGWEYDECLIVPRGTTGAVKFREVIE